MIRFIAALAVLLVATPALAQDTDREAERPDRFGRFERMEQRRQAQIERRERMERLRARFRGDGVHLRVFRSYALPEGATATEPVVVIGGSARIDGHLEDDVVVIGGSVRLGPTAVVDGNVVTVGGEVTMDPGATVAGTIDEAVIPWPSIVFDPDWNTSGLWTALAVGGAVTRLFAVLAISVLLTLVAPGWIDRIAGRPAGLSGVLGVATEVLFVPSLLILMVALVVSIVGIPLLAAIPFLLAAFGVVWVAGFTGVAVRLGRALRGSGAAASASVPDFLLGYVAIVAVTVTGYVLAFGLGWFSPMVWPLRFAGLMIEYVAWTIGLGAALGSLFAAPRLVPPPVPVRSGL